MDRRYVRNALEVLMNQQISEMKDRIIHSINHTECHLSFNPTRFYDLTYHNFNRIDQQSIYKPHLAFIVLSFEAIENMIVTRHLALSCRYSAAIAILRQCLEMLLKAAFYDSVAFDVKENNTTTSAFRTEINNRLTTDEELRNLASESTIFILDIVSDMENGQQNLVPNLHDITTNLEGRQLLDPIPFGFTYELYRTLCKSIHGNVHATDIFQRLNQGTTGYTTTFVDTALQEFIENYEKVIDVALVLSFNILKREMTQENVVEVCARILADEDGDNDLRGMPHFRTLCNAFI